MDSLQPTDRSRIKRLHERGSYDRAAIDAVLDAGLVCHVGYSFDDHPYVTTTSYWRDGGRVYWHGSSASRMLRRVKGGVPVCFNVALIDGLIMARSGFHHSINYRNVMLFGRAEPLDDPEAKLAALEAFTERLWPGRWAEMRATTTQELKATTVVAMAIEEGGAKIRTGPPKDDEEDYALDIWAGVIPLKLTAGAPVPDPRLKPGIPLPAHIEGFDLEQG
jgi:nitroimidazol reductase NimA-like FMN-containing flavoprotein (pyridoxamine 5'-phosphate oxidase superfamily)